MEMPRFHLAFPVRDLQATRRFYVDLLDARVGREAERWIDFDFFGHQLTAHLVVAAPEAMLSAQDSPTNPVDGDDVPIPHFGVILEWSAWHSLAERLESAGVEFLIPPRVRFQGQVGEQATLFVVDPSGNCLELKSFQDPNQVFAR